MSTVEYSRKNLARLPYYKIVIPNKETFYGYVYGLHCKLDIEPHSKTDSQGQLSPNLMHAFRYIVVNKDTYERQLLSEAFICAPTYYKDSVGSSVYCYDIVEINVDDSTYSSIYPQYGLVIFNSYTLAFEILFIPYRETLSLCDVSFKVVGHLGNPEDSLNYLNLRHGSHEFEKYSSYLNDLTESSSPIVNYMSDSLDTVYLQPNFRHRDDRKELFYGVPLQNGDLELYIYLPKYDHLIEEEFTNIAKVPDEIFLSIKPDYIISKDKIFTSIRGVHIFIPEIQSYLGAFLSIGDKLLLKRDLNIWGTLDYFVNEAAFGVKIPRSVKTYDGIFNGRAGLFSHKITGVPRTVYEEEYMLRALSKYKGNRGQLLWRTSY